MLNIAQRIAGISQKARGASPDRIPLESSPSSPSRPPRPSAMLTDAIYQRLDHQRPGGTPASSIQALTSRIKNALRPGRPINGGMSTTQFRNIAAKGTGLYQLTLPNNVQVHRTQEETELHVLLQSQMRLTDPTWRDTGDSVDLNLVEQELDLPSEQDNGAGSAHCMPASAPDRQAHALPRTRAALSGKATPTFSAPARANTTNPAASRPSATVPGATVDHVLSMEDQLGNRSRIYTPNGIDMNTVNERLLVHTHLTKSISSAGNHCWWRAALLSALFQRSPQELEATLVAKLGDDFRGDAALIRRMGEALRSSGMHAILTNMTLQALSADLESPSSLKMPGLPDGQDNGAGEEACQRVVNALLERRNASDTERMAAIFGSGMGEMHHVKSLLGELGCATIVFSRPWGNFNQNTGATFDPSTSTVEVCAPPGSMLHQIQDAPTREERTENLLRHTDDTPILIHQGAHFNLCIPGHQIHLSPFQYPRGS